MSSDQAAAVGAFLSGVGSVLTAGIYTRRQRKRADADCDKRLADYDRALHEGIAIARHQDETAPPAG
jgi:hypothetical protein